MVSHSLVRCAWSSWRCWWYLPERPEEPIDGALLRGVEGLREGAVLVHGVDVEAKSNLSDGVQGVPAADHDHQSAPTIIASEISRHALT